MREREMAPISEEEIEEFTRKIHARFWEMSALLVRKRQAYGQHNLEMFGEFGIAVRASDKVQRIAQMSRGVSSDEGDGESLEDAWRDLLGYAVLGLQMHLDSRQKSRLEERYVGDKISQRYLEELEKQGEPEERPQYEKIYGPGDEISKEEQQSIDRHVEEEIKAAAREREELEKLKAAKAAEEERAMGRFMRTGQVVVRRSSS